MRLETIEFPQGLKPRLFLLQLRHESSGLKPRPTSRALSQSQDISLRFAACLSKLDKMIIHLAQAESKTQAQDASGNDRIPSGAEQGAEKLPELAETSS